MFLRRIKSLLTPPPLRGAAPAQADEQGGSLENETRNAEAGDSAPVIDSAGTASGESEAAGARHPAGSGLSAVSGGGDTPAAVPLQGSDISATATNKPPRETEAMRRGRVAEAAAADFLMKAGHRILERNWRAGRDEIDLITVDGPCLVFVEVRARAQEALVGGYHSIDKRKRTALRRVCFAYLGTCRPRPRTYRFDVVQIALGKGGQMTIHHYAGVSLLN